MDLSGHFTRQFDKFGGIMDYIINDSSTKSRYLILIRHLPKFQIFGLTKKN